MKRQLLILLLIPFSLRLSAQTNFIKAGKIEFERKTNTHRLYFSGESDSWTEEFKKLIPQFRTEYFDLVFNGNKSLYKPGREVDVPKTGFFESPAMSNVIYTDLDKSSAISQKQVFEGLFLVSDSIKKFDWKMEAETREIAGYECKKAVTRICDSVVVVAFYTDEIIPSAGPETFNGLPGMILGIAIPRLYTTWFATKVEMLDDKDRKTLAPPQKGKKSDDSEMVSTVDKAIKNWGDKYHDRAIWFITL